MPTQLSRRSIPGRVPLRTLLIIPFLLQLVLVVGGVWYLSFRNGQEAVNQVAHQLRNEITLRIQEHLYRFTHTLHQLNQIHVNAIQQGVPPADAPTALERYFWEQIQLFPTVTSIYFGNPAGGLVDAGREGAGGDPVKANTHLGEIVTEVVRFDLSGSNIRPIFDIPENLWLAQVDPGQIQQVFSNLAINAAQAMPDGGSLYIRLENVEVQAEAIASLDPGKYIKTTVADEGSGIRETHLERIFDPYFSTKPSGNGLGLATVHSIIDKHAGHIQVDSEPGRGSRFTLYLPAFESGEPPEPARSTENAPALKGSGRRVLVMDDDAMVRDLASQMLESLGYQAETAADGQEALDRYAEALEAGRRFDLVIMDLTVPGGMGGQEAIARLLDLDPAARAMVSSGYAEDPVMAKYGEYGFKGIISKPYQIRQLQAVLSQVLTTG